MRSGASVETPINGLIAGIPEQRLRALIVELAMTVLRCLATSDYRAHCEQQPSQQRAAPTAPRPDLGLRCLLSWWRRRQKIV